MELPKALKPTFSFVPNFAQNLKIKMEKGIFLGINFLKFFLPHFHSHLERGPFLAPVFLMFWIGSRHFSPFNVKYLWGCPHMMDH
jgi:hypothetical protein